MSSLLSPFLSIGLVAVATAQPPGFSSAREALDSWERLGQTAAHRDVLTHAEAVRTLASKGDQLVVSRLVRIAENKVQGLDSRTHAALVATQVADAASAETVLAWVRDTSTELAQAEADTNFTDRKTILIDNRSLLTSFIMKGAENLLDDLQDHTLIATLAKETCLLSWSFGTRDGRLKSEAARLLARCKVPEAFRDDAFIEVICDKTGTFVKPEILVEQLGDHGREKLRERVRSGASSGKLRSGAAEALTHLGDESILPDLRALQAAMMSDPSKAERAPRMLNYIWRIEVQHPPQKLLDYIESTDHCGYRDCRSWALRRAVTLGVEPARVREAILTHDRNASTKLGRVQTKVLKRVGLELGILHVNDLPDVVLRDRRPIP